LGVVQTTPSKKNLFLRNFKRREVWLNSEDDIGEGQKPRRGIGLVKMKKKKRESLLCVTLWVWSTHRPVLKEK
jgi:hypothetical protein